MANLFKLEKLKIEAYDDRKRPEGRAIKTFEAMFNPESFSRKYGISYQKCQSINSSGKEAKFSRNEPPALNLKLLLDGTGVDQIGILNLGRTKKVSERVEDFLDLAFQIRGKIHEPHFLKIKWGDLKFDCRLSSVDISYTSFDRDGTALRAELDVSFVADEDDRKRMARDKMTSPDLTHGRVVRSGDTLPLLTKAVYGTSAHYLRVAEINQLDNFRDLTPGQEIFFPPLET